MQQHRRVGMKIENEGFVEIAETAGKTEARP
jgi:hypothetical protein